jgi:hypothetical protein
MPAQRSRPQDESEPGRPNDPTESAAADATRAQVEAEANTAPRTRADLEAPRADAPETRDGRGDSQAVSPV